jgi:hypothetical protein
VQAETARRLVVVTSVSKFEAYKYASKLAKERLLDVINLFVCFYVKICEIKGYLDRGYENHCLLEYDTV